MPADHGLIQCSLRWAIANGSETMLGQLDKSWQNQMNESLSGEFRDAYLVMWSFWKRNEAKVIIEK